MANQWVRLWVDMPNDPKWKTISKVSKQPISLVISVFVHLMCDAANANERGRTQANAEDLASALDVENEHIEAVLSAMQGRVLDENRLIGWDTRQPIREDGSAERSKAWREKQKQRTRPNATEQKRALDTDTDTDTDTEEKRTVALNNVALCSGRSVEKIMVVAGQKPAKQKISEPDPPKRKTRIDSDMPMTPERVDEAKRLFPKCVPADEWKHFIDHFKATGETRADWFASWRTWLRNGRKFAARHHGRIESASVQHRII